MKMLLLIQVVMVGASGDTITIPSGATITNNGTSTGFASIEWQAVKTANFTASAGQGIFADTSSGGWTLTLPAGSAGATIEVVDYAGTFAVNNLTITPNGSEKIEGATGSKTLATSITRSSISLCRLNIRRNIMAHFASREQTEKLFRY